MATIKSYTDLEQSKKLAEIIPLESADTYIGNYVGESGKVDGTNIHYYPKGESFGAPEIIDAWSLAALLNVLRTFTTPTAFSVKVSTPSLIKIENGYKLTYTGDYTPMINNELDVEAPIESVADNAIDCCVNMIVLLYELK